MWPGGAFGLFHATLEDWFHPGRLPLLDKVFDLKTRCLTELMQGPNRERDALRLVSARHAYSFVARTPTENDQQAWAKRWAKIISTYNPGPKYALATDGLNTVVREGIEKYGAR
ncbi:MAG: hypothetical protein EHM89_12755 [Acidobacteria bacterium]|nr:MAG: hypothetical protein EHM89_12755 [Acidobacteriota bacterium]